MQDDFNLVKKILNGDIQHFTTLVEKYENRVYKTCYRFAQNGEDALDLTQEVFIKIYNNLNNFKGSSSLSTWIYKISVNTCLNFLRKKNCLVLEYENYDNPSNLAADSNFTRGMPAGTSANQDSKEFSLYNSPERYIEMKELLELLDLNLEKSGEKNKKIFIFRLFHGMSFKEIAKKIGVTPESARMNYSRTRRSLKESLEEYQKGE